MTAMVSGLDTAMARVGDRWTLLVVEALFDGPQRFSDLQGAIPGVAATVLSARLRRLEQDGLVSASPYSRRPLRLEYRITDTGRELAGAVLLLTRWGTHHVGGSDATGPRHKVCGTALEPRWYCPTCAVWADGEEDDLTWV